MHTVMTSRVAFSNFTWQLFRAGYQPSCRTGGAAGDCAITWMLRIQMLRSFEKQAANKAAVTPDMCYSEFAFVNYFERDCSFNGGRQSVAGLPATDVVSKASIQGISRVHDV